MAQQVLEESGVTAFVFKDDAGGMEPHLQRTSGVRLIVGRADAERAAEILQTLNSNCPIIHVVYNGNQRFERDLTGTSPARVTELWQGKQVAAIYLVVCAGPARARSIA